MTNEQLKELWGDELFNVFADHITEDGWLTKDWNQIIENEIPRFDKDYNDNEKYTDSYQRMYLLNYVESDCGNFIKPQI